MPWPQFDNVDIMRGCPGWISGGWLGILLFIFLSGAYNSNDYKYKAVAQGILDDAFSNFDDRTKSMQSFAMHLNKASAGNKRTCIASAANHRMGQQ